MASNGSSAQGAPEADQIEVSVFGPGYGECIVVHLGENDWIIVDSCLDRASGEPTALRYLRGIGIDVSTQVKRLIITHWDDDHINGVAQTYRLATSAKLAVSGALSSAEFESVLATWRPAAFISGGSGVSEMDQVYAELRTRRPPGHSHATAIHASENKEIFARTGKLPATVKALSPSDAGVLAATANFKEIREKVLGRRRLPRIEDNHASVVLSLQIGNLNLLLGGDLQVTKNRSFGWFAILDAGPHPLHEMFKLSHHGSENGHAPEVWEKLLCDNPFTVITPFVRGAIALPSRVDCERILARTTNSFLTAPPRPRTFRDPERGAEKAIIESVLAVHQAPSIFGHVRLRKAALGDDAHWSVDLFGDALSVRDYLDKATA